MTKLAVLLGLFTLLYMQFEPSPIMLPAQTPVEWFTFFMLGFVGLLLHVGIKAMKLGRTLDVFLVYLKQNSLTVAITFFCYVAVIAVWLTNGLEFLGLYKGHLNAMTISVAYMSQSLFKEMVDGMASKAKVKADAKEMKDAGGTP